MDEPALLNIGDLVLFIWCGDPRLGEDTPAVVISKESFLEHLTKSGIEPDEYFSQLRAVIDGKIKTNFYRLACPVYQKAFRRPLSVIFDGQEEVSPQRINAKEYAERLKKELEILNAKEHEIKIRLCGVQRELGDIRDLKEDVRTYFDFLTNAQ